MLVKVKIRSEQKYVKVHSDVKLCDFLDEAFVKFGIMASSRPEAKLYDESGTEVDADGFEEILLPNTSNELTHVPPVSSEESSIEISSIESDDTILLSDDSPTRKRRAEDEAGIMVKKVLQTKPGGDGVIREYNKTKSLSDSSRRKMVNILTADMTEKHRLRIQVRNNKGFIQSQQAGKQQAMQESHHFGQADSSGKQWTADTEKSQETKRDLETTGEQEPKPPTRTKQVIQGSEGRA
ncbi:hypothetical protein Q8A67_022833 [Cirrhinus molitorella]|uniref:Uncharacterized protein n=1 Tax=Cirrhinus molitorella TaxID=172907 RepID=A0AA88P8L2_9TELE|nr:hypothetical protein Q8A67_022833 [Cirrhinus molitorella]